MRNHVLTFELNSFQKYLFPDYTAPYTHAHPSLLGEQNPSTKGNKFITIIPQPTLPSVQTKPDLPHPRFY